MSVGHEAMVESIQAALDSKFGKGDRPCVAMAPGRVNLIGEYTDFNDGFVFPMTVDRGVYLAIRPRTDKTVRLASVRYEESIEYKLDDFELPKAGSWQSYVSGVIEELRLRGHLTGGFEAVIDGNLNLGAGLSSSAAVEVATAVGLQEVFGFEMDRVDLVTLCQHVEHNYANVLCGIMDQFACGIGRSGHALLLDCRSLEHENIPVQLGEHRIVIVSSEVKRSLASSAYNSRRAQCQDAVEHFSIFDSGIRALRDVNTELFEIHGDELSPVVRRRCRHVIAENQRTLSASDALKRGDLGNLGELMNASHRSLRDDFEVSCPELDLLVKLANRTDGVVGSRMTGAGFGGCTVTIVHKDAVDVLVDTLTTEYPARVNLIPRIFVLGNNLEAGRVRLN